MSDTQHTPGPWNIERRDNPPGGLKDGYLLIGGSVAAVQAPEHDSQAAANARLIAAAPDLLEACNRALELHGPDDCDCDLYDKGEVCPCCEFRAAIAKATK